jgi:antitoxin VapB
MSRSDLKPSISDFNLCIGSLYKKIDNIFYKYILGCVYIIRNVVYASVGGDELMPQRKETVLTTTRVFKSGNSQAVRLPKEFSVRSKVLEIFRRGDEIVLREPAIGLARAFELLANLPDDFLAEGRQDIPPQHREGL